MSMNTSISRLQVDINLHRLCGDEQGYEASTRTLTNTRGLYYVGSGNTPCEAFDALQEAIGQPCEFTVRFVG